MKTNLNSGSSLFKKSKITVRSIEETEMEKAVNKDYTDVDDLIERVNAAIESRNEDEVKWLQLELQMRTMIFMKIIDWKMWEIYNKFVK